GEVVERPASVVKELVENSLDAQAGSISVEIQAGGRSLIRVSDDGVGMSKDDALLCLERHATSKIRTAEDLQSIQTMGFRGEALPSIASVCRMTLTTRERDGDPAGTQVIINGGKLVDVKAAGSPPGTSIEVRGLFFNVPARRKFLRSEETEYGHIYHYLTLAALAYPHVGFSFLRDGKPVWQLAPSKDLRERLRALLGNETQLVAVDATSNETEKPLRVWGFVGKPGVSRATRENQYVFVNRRPIENRGLNYALLEGYHTSLMKGRFPVCCLFLEIDSAEVDVNIHPAKREVKFHQEAEVRRFVAEAIRETLMAYHAPPPAPVPNIEITPEPPRELPTFTPLTGTALASWPKPKAVEIPPANATPKEPEPQSFRHEEPSGPSPLLKVPLRLVGVIGKLYVVFESDRGMVLLDQHAAHERILFEQMIKRMQRGNAPSQRLLLPETIELAMRDAQFLRQLMPTLNRLGVGLSDFGERTFLLDGLPPFVKAREPRRFVLELIDQLRTAGQTVNTVRLGEDVIAKTVCRHAVKANDALASAELENLINDLRNCDMPYTCPHGRPTILEMNYRELEKKFGRLQ
ncbi:MAG TPA: DNA mismatch repair endonuclease MutL, partial [Verrucomicrobiae bacterium]|nr:DNA mismatch repair endonuclease MutL [Verrucomicrobiae bacterium]